MKKVILSLALFVAGICTVMAQAPAKYATISMGASEISVAERADWSDAFDNGYDAIAYNPKGLAIVSGGERFSAWATNDLSDVELEIALDAPVTSDVTLTFSNVIGDVHLSLDGTDVTLINGGSVVIPAADFGADGKYSKSIKVNPAVVAKQFCFRENTLFIDGYKGDATITIDGTAVVIDSDHFTRAFTQAEAGRHTLHIDGQDYLFDAFPAVTKKN